MSETISKASVCEILADIYPTDGEKVVAVMEVDKAYEAIQQLPSAQPDRKKGKWLTNEEIVRPTRFIKWFCSRCGYVFESVDSPGYKFCPGCGSYNGGDEE